MSDPDGLFDLCYNASRAKNSSFLTGMYLILELEKYHPSSLPLLSLFISPPLKILGNKKRNFSFNCFINYSFKDLVTTLSVLILSQCHFLCFAQGFY